MANYTTFFNDLPNLTRDNRTLLWAKSVGIWLGLTVAALIFGNVVNIYTAQVTFLGDAIENVLGWGGVIWAVLSVINIGVTLNRLHVEKIIADAIKEDRKERAHRATAS